MNWMRLLANLYPCLVNPSSGGEVTACATLVSHEETSRLVKNLKAVLPVSTYSAVGGDTQRSSGESPLSLLSICPLVCVS